MIDSIWLVMAFPLAGTVLLHFLGKRIGEPIAGWIASAAIGGSFVVALIAAVPFIRGDGATGHVMLWNWMPALGASFEIEWDPLAALMTLVVSGVGTLIHIYSVGYMHGDERFSRFFTYLNLFAFSMLTLVLAGNFAMLFMGWELVGLCSYLLISFWYTKPSAAAAGKKAFIVNRIGDFGFVIALMMVFTTFGTLSYSGVFDRAGDLLTEGAATAIGLLLLVGAAGKSAQVPLYVWLPDAMEGPTPVSALIHAATMVTAGVYVVARTSAIFELAPAASLTVATVGAITALWAATIALAQNDIKRVLAYSTISQLGYMFLGVGLTAYVAGVFHLMTHAFFKALLFLAAGSVIHGMSGEQDMLKMGGLRKHMPVTALTMGIATLAISGVPPFAGFWSKDEILAVAFEAGGYATVLWFLGVLTAMLTAFYMTRQFVLVFMGKSRWEEGVHPHESPRVMTIPLMVLALLSIGAGFVNTPFFGNGLEHFLEPSFEFATLAHPSGGFPMFFLLAGISVIAGVGGIVMAYLAYNRPRELWERFQEGFGKAWTAWAEAYRVDDFYGKVLVGPGKAAAEAAAFKLDLPIVDGAVNGIARVVRSVGSGTRTVQTGFVRNYGVTFVIGLVAMLIWIVVRGA